MMKFSAKNKVQATPPVCKAVPPPPTTPLPPPGTNALATITYIGATSGVPVNVSATIGLTVSGTGPAYNGHTTTPDGTLLILSGLITYKPASANLTLIGQSANGDFFSAIGSSDAIAYNPWLTSELIQLTPADAGATAAVSLAQ